jgi:hypothetical protein
VPFLEIVRHPLSSERAQMGVSKYRIDLVLLECGEGQRKQWRPIPRPLAVAAGRGRCRLGACAAQTLFVKG